jgi:hypothetical protein
MSEGTSIAGRAREVADKAQFVEFLKALKTDLASHPGDWENNRLDSFLEGMSGFAGDIEGYYANRKEAVDLQRPSWRTFAEILVAARVYE